MSVSVVNGYLCMSGCDAAKARRGENPREPTNPVQANSEDLAVRRDPSVVFGGTLADERSAIRVADAVHQAKPQHIGGAVDLLA